MIRSPWIWPMIIIASAVSADVVVDGGLDTAIRAFLVMWFLLVCPGMMVMRFFFLNKPVVEWTLALALSVALDAFVASVALYAGKWSPTAVFDFLAIFCIIGAAVQFSCARYRDTFILERRD